MIIGLAGKARSGKDTAADGLAADGWEVRGFADPVKALALSINPVANYRMCGDAGEPEYLADLVNIEGWEGAKIYPEVRRFLQRLGTEGIRIHIGTNTWVDLAMQNVAPNTVFSDVRFPNEADAIRERGGIIVEIVRPNNQYQTTHDSEQLDFYKDEQIVNNGTIPELQTALKIIAASHTGNT